ncbi:hypothetical protein C0993_012446 [Termitomyces sp. T159_Od127]|nr:hypothetical protein C0993_012446 [Termitomyces sp. T159_Od127]
MKSAWLGLEMVLKRAESFLDGTPFKGPISAINMFIDLGNAISDNKDAQQELFTQAKKRLELVNLTLKKVEEQDTEFREAIEDFAQVLVKKILELKAMLGKSKWKVILESDEDKTKVGNILVSIDEETKTFIVSAQIE